MDATNRRNIARLRDERDAAGLRQLVDVLTSVGADPDLIRTAEDAIAWIADTTPADVTPTAQPRLGDIITYQHAGREHLGVVIAVTDDTATTNHGHRVPLHP